MSSTHHVGLKTSNIKNKSFDDEYFKKLIVEYIKEFGKAERRDINALINDKLPEYMTERQRYDKITTLLSALKRRKILIYDGKNWLFVK